MKKLFATVILSFILCVFCSAATEPGFLLMADASHVPEHIGTSGCVLEYSDISMTVISTEDLNDGKNGDPFLVFNNVNLKDEYCWVKMRIKNLSEATQFEMHFASTATNDGITAATCTHYPISSKDTEFKEYIFNIKDANLSSQVVNEVTLEESVWKGNISTLRFDCMWMAEPSGQMPKGSAMEIDYIAIFDTKEAAEAYVAPERTVDTTDYTQLKWDEDSLVFIFDTPESVSRWSSAGCVTSFEFGNMKIVPSGFDPYVTTGLTDDEKFDANKYPWVGYRYKMSTKGTIGGFFFTSSTLTKLSDASYSQYTLLANNKWVNHIIDMRTAKHGNWGGIINFFRIDPINGIEDTDASIYINRIGFFKTEAEAKAFTAQGTSEDYSSVASFGDKKHMAKIPGNTLSDGYDKTEYMLSDTKVNSTNDVVMRTNADGSVEIVPLCYISNSEFITYIASKPGKYSLTSNAKIYSDTDGHWGKNYIDFVSARTLFGGTSPTEFSPDTAMTRGMFITVLGRMHGVDISKYSGDTGYTDVSPSEYYAPYIMWAKSEGLMDGTSDTTFAPEEPIYRETMALVIANYIKASEFETIYYSIDNEEEFTDIADCDAETVEAIELMQKYGIINGKGNARFDPKGSSTRAEVAAVMQRTVITVLNVSSSVPASAKSHEYITRDRIRMGIWGFPAKFCTVEGVKYLAELGVDLVVRGECLANTAVRNILINYADLYGIELYMYDYGNGAQVPSENYVNSMLSTDLKMLVSDYENHPSFAGHYLTDEPGTDYYDEFAKITEYYEKTLPGKKIYTNLLPMYANAAQLKYGASQAAIEYYDADPDLYRKYCEEWFESYDYDYISTDIYPLNWVGGKGVTKTTYRDYVESINQIASVARERGKEFWCFIQTFGWNDTKRTPNEAEYRWQCYSMLSFGCTGILLWTYDGSGGVYDSMINTATMTPSDAYYDLQKVFSEIKQINDVYLEYKNVGAFTHNPKNIDYVRMSNQYKDFSPIASLDSNECVLVGCFEKKDGSGGTAFTLVNMEEFQHGNNANVKIKFNSNVEKVTLYNRGVPSVLDISDGEADFVLPIGEGYFITVE